MPIQIHTIQTAHDWIQQNPHQKKMGILNNLIKLTKTHKRVMFIFNNYMISVWSRWNWKIPLWTADKNRGHKECREETTYDPKPTSSSFLLDSCSVQSKFLTEKNWNLHRKCSCAVSAGYQKPPVQPRRYSQSDFATWQTTE